jgi:hypothetical protein
MIFLFISEPHPCPREKEPMGTFDHNIQCTGRMNEFYHKPCLAINGKCLAKTQHFLFSKCLTLLAYTPFARHTTNVLYIYSYKIIHIYYKFFRRSKTETL